MEQIRYYKKEDPEYPERLKNISGAPKELYVQGSLPEEHRLSVAVIGARDCSEYGKYVARELGSVLGSNNISVVSGMARGIDGISQEAALNAGGSSFAVLGCGVDICYPEANRQLYERLKICGGILSEYPPGSPALACHFPPRNRIVSGLADVVVVIEARVKSGTLITVDMALEQGREVYVVPGRVTDRLSDGCNSLIKQGAGILLSPEEFLRELLEGEIGKAARSLSVERRKKKEGEGRKEGEKKGEGRTKGEEWTKGEWAKGEGRTKGEEWTKGEGWAKGEGWTKGEWTKGEGRAKGEGQAKGEGWKEREGEEGEAYKGDSAGRRKANEISAGLSPELEEVLGALDFTPQTSEQVRAMLPKEYQDKQIITYLMRLCMEKLAVQVSPGRFCRVKG